MSTKYDTFLLIHILKNKFIHFFLKERKIMTSDQKRKRKEKKKKKKKSFIAHIKPKVL